MSQPRGTILPNFDWVELSIEPYVERYECLSLQMKAEGLENSFEAMKRPIDAETWKEIQPLVKQKSGIRLGRGWGEGILGIIPDHSVHISRLGAADCLIQEEGRWWPRSASYQGMLEVMASYGKNFDLNSSVLIVGAGAMARTSVAVLFREGFKRFSITAMDKDRGLKLIEQMSRIFLGAEFKFIPKNELILLPGVYGVVVNTTPSIDENELIQELSYFNFFAPGGVVVDLYFTPPITRFLKEAQEVGGQIIPGHLVAAATDRIWCKWAANIDINEVAYSERLNEKFQSKV